MRLYMKEVFRGEVWTFWSRENAVNNKFPVFRMPMNLVYHLIGRTMKYPEVVEVETFWREVKNEGKSAGSKDTGKDPRGRKAPWKRR